MESGIVRPSPGGSRLVLTGRPPLAALRMPAAYPGKRHPAFELLHLQKQAARGCHPHQLQDRRHYYTSQSSLSSGVTTESEDVSMDDDDDDADDDVTSWESFPVMSGPFPVSPVSSRRSHAGGRSQKGHPTSVWDSEDVTSADYDIIFHRPAVTSTPCRRRHPAGRQSHHQPSVQTRHPIPANSFSSLRALQGSDVSTMTSPPSPQQQQEYFRFDQQRLPEVKPAHQQQMKHQLLPRHSTPLGQRRHAGPRRSLYTNRKSTQRYVMDDIDVMTSSTRESGYSSHGDPLSGSGSDQGVYNQASRHYVTSCDSSDVMTSDSESHSGMMTYNSGIRYQSRMSSQSSMMTSETSSMMTSDSDMMTYQSGVLALHSAMTYRTDMTSQSSVMTSQSEYPCSSDDSELTLGEKTLESLSQAEQEAYADDLETYFRSTTATLSSRNDTDNRTGRSISRTTDVDTTVFSTASDATDFMQKPANRKLPVTARAHAPQQDRRKVIARCLKKVGRKLKLTGKTQGSALQTLAIV